MILIGETANCLLLHSVPWCVFKVANFRYHGNSHVWVKFVEHSLIGRPRKPYNRAKNDESILYTTGVMANFLFKFRNFRYHANRGWCDTNYVCKVKFTDPENPMFCARIGGHICSTRKVLANFLLKIGKFSLPWQQGSSEQSLTDTI